MKKMMLAISMFLLFCMAGVFAQTDAEMKLWKDYMTPGDVHKMIAASDGEWVQDVTFWMDPAAPPTKATAMAKNEMILGGRYQVSKSSGDMMGMPFEGMSLLGYDNSTKKFTSTWIDNFGTGTLTMEGTWDGATKSITFNGKGVDPMTGKEVMMKQIWKFIDNDTQELLMFDNKTGKEVKSMEIKMTRKK